MNPKPKLIALGLVCACIAGCGGGGGDGSSGQTPTPTATAEGFWIGTLSGNGTSETYEMAILENGDTWGIEMSGAYLVGATFGHTTSSGTQLSGVINFPPAENNITYTGSFTAKSSLNARFSSSTSTASLTYAASYGTQSGLVYDQPPPALSTIAGTYTGSALSVSTSSTVSIAISSSGAITGSSGGCNASGTVQPRASGKNVFDITLRFQGNCALGNGVTAQGEAIYNPGNRVIWAMALNSAKTDGYFFSGNK